MKIEYSSNNHKMLTKEISSLGTLMYADASLDAACSLFRQNKGELISIQDAIYARFELGFGQENSFERALSKNCLWVKEGWIYDPNRKVSIWLKRSWLLSRGRIAHVIDEHSRGEVHYLPETFCTQHYCSDQPDKYFTFDNISPMKISSLDRDERAVWLLGNQLERIAQYYYDNGVKTIDLACPDEKGPNGKRHTRPYLNQMTLGMLSGEYARIGGILNKMHEKHPTFGIIRK